MKKLVIVLLLLFMPTASIAGGNLGRFYDGDELKDVGASNSSNLKGVFMGYVAGVADSLNQTGFYIPESAKADQLAAVVRKYLEDHPERWHFTASSLVADALMQSFPCKR